ncbi:hypothetical protein JCM5296_004765 [Sporobolomyces johnsonii]
MPKSRSSLRQRLNDRLEAIRTAFEEIYESAGSADGRVRQEVLDELDDVPVQIHMRNIRTPENLRNLSSKHYPGLVALYRTSTRDVVEHSIAHLPAHSYGQLSLRQRAIYGL